MAIDLRPEVEASLSECESGYIDGLAAYAVWRDGTQEVGSTGTTLRQAIERFLRERGHDLPEGA